MHTLLLVTATSIAFVCVQSAWVQKAPILSSQCGNWIKIEADPQGFGYSDCSWYWQTADGDWQKLQSEISETSTSTLAEFGADEHHLQFRGTRRYNVQPQEMRRGNLLQIPRFVGNLRIQCRVQHNTESYHPGWKWTDTVQYQSSQHQVIIEDDVVLPARAAPYVVRASAPDPKEPPDASAQRRMYYSKVESDKRSESHDCNPPVDADEEPSVVNDPRVCTFRPRIVQGLAPEVQSTQQSVTRSASPASPTGIAAPAPVPKSDVNEGKKEATQIDTPEVTAKPDAQKSSYDGKKILICLVIFAHTRFFSHYSLCLI